MRQGAAIRVFLLMAVVAPTLLCGGCATVCLKIIADHRFQDAPPPRCDQAEIKVGDRLDLTLKDGRHMRGHFRNLDCGSDSCMVLGPYMGNSGLQSLGT